MVNNSADTESTQAKAAQEFDHYVSILKEKGVEVAVFDDTLEPHTPDSIFPNNWVSFHTDGTVILYPMKAKNRRLERRPDIIEKLESEYNFKVTNKVDITEGELNEKFLEGTGSIVFDYINKIAYACISQRTDKDLLEKVCEKLGYKAHTFTSVDANGTEIYHTNVMMCVGERFALLCAQSVPDATERENLIKTLTETGHEIVYLTYEQICHFAGNALEVTNTDKKRFLIVSKAGYDSLSEDQKEAIQLHDEIIPIPLTVIETNGGGSARCMISDIRLPKKL
jgi:hypothetical protein